MIRDEHERSLWSRSDRLELSATGREAEAAYRATIVASRDTSGRASYDTARALWARERSLEPDDGVYLGELVAGPVGFSNVVTALETCGKSREDATKAFGRLIRTGFVIVHGREPADAPR